MLRTRSKAESPIHPPALIAPTLLVWRTLGYYLFIALGFYLTLHTARQAARRKAERGE